MKRILVIGCPGSGKSTFSRKLQSILQIPLCYLDMLYWNEDKTTVSKEVFISRLKEVLKAESFIIDGNYSSTMEMRIKASDTVFFLDYPTELCLEGVRNRIGKQRPDMPWIETEEDHDFMEYIRTFSASRRDGIFELLEKYSEKTIFIFKNREEASLFLEKHIN